MRKFQGVIANILFLVIPGVARNLAVSLRTGSAKQLKSVRDCFAALLLAMTALFTLHFLMFTMVHAAAVDDIVNDLQKNLSETCFVAENRRHLRVVLRDGRAVTHLVPRDP